MATLIVVSDKDKPQALPAERDFYDLYFNYIGETEAPKIFHRWCAIGAIAALLGRQCWLPFGTWNFYPNMYILLMGSAGARKGTALKAAKRMMEKQDYKRFSSTRASKERFLMDMRSIDLQNESLDDILEMRLDEPSELTVMADEFTGFTGMNNLPFLLDLAEIWDCPAVFTHPKIHGTSVVVDLPTLNIISSSQPEMIATALPPEAIGQGSMSRIILVFGEPTGEKITLPEPPSEAAIVTLAERVFKIRNSIRGEFKFTTEARSLCDRLYREYTDLEDFRFKHYNTRRFTHLLKLATVFTATRLSMAISETDLLQANTLLHYTELRMPKALGEFGKSRNADVTNRVLDVIREAKYPVGTKYIWKILSHDLEREEQLKQIIKGLLQAEKIQLKRIADKEGFVVKNNVRVTWKSELLLSDFLTAEEML